MLTTLLQHPPVNFHIDSLEAGSSYRIILYAANAKGRSEPTIIDEITFKGVAKYTGRYFNVSKFSFITSRFYVYSFDYSNN